MLYGAAVHFSVAMHFTAHVGPKYIGRPGGSHVQSPADFSPQLHVP